MHDSSHKRKNVAEGKNGLFSENLRFFRALKKRFKEEV